MITILTLPKIFYNLNDRQPADTTLRPKFQLQMKPPIQGDTISFGAPPMRNNENVGRYTKLDVKHFVEVFPDDGKLLEEIFESKFLTPREKTVIIASYGLNDLISRNEKDVSELFGISIRNVCNTKGTGKRKIKQNYPALFKKIKYFGSLMGIFPAELRLFHKLDDSFFYKTLNKEEQEAFKKAIETFTPQAKIVFALRFGLFGEESPYSQEEIGGKFEPKINDSRITYIESHVRGKIAETDAKTGTELIRKLEDFSVFMKFPGEYRRLYDLSKSEYAKTLTIAEREKFLDDTKTLTPKEKVVLSLRYGLNGEKSFPRYKIREAFKHDRIMTKQCAQATVKQTESDIKEKINPELMEKLKDFALLMQIPPGSRKWCNPDKLYYVETLKTEAEKTAFLDFFKTLTPRERVILVLLYGLHGEDRLLRKTMGEHVGLKVSKISMIALDLLPRMPSDVKIKLKEFLKSPDNNLSEIQRKFMSDYSDEALGIATDLAAEYDRCVSPKNVAGEALLYCAENKDPQKRGDIEYLTETSRKIYALIEQLPQNLRAIVDAEWDLFSREEREELVKAHKAKVDAGRDIRIRIKDDDADDDDDL